jgi:hypothetical protein
MSDDKPAKYANAPNGWGIDPLTQFFDAAQRNSFSTFVNRKTMYDPVLECDGIYEAITNNLSDPLNEITAFLLVRCHSAYRAAARLAVATQVPEAFPLLRLCLEYGAYASLFESDDASRNIWINRNQSDQNLKQARNSLTWPKSVAAVGAKDNSGKLQPLYQELYERCLTYGAHPNEDAVFQNMTMADLPNGGHAHTLRYLSAESTMIEFALRTAAQVGFATLRVWQLLLSERFTLLGLDARLDQLGRSEL